MKKLLILFALLVGTFGYSQVMLNKATKFLGITTTVRNSLTINANEFPVIYNTTTGQFERYNGATWETWVAGDVTEADIIDLQAYTLPADFDTFAELDALVADKTLVNTADAQNLTNKTISGSSNTISGITGSMITDNTIDGNDLADIFQYEVYGRVLGGTGNPAPVLISSFINSGNIPDGTIDELDLDASVNASLDLADSALQSGDVTAATVDAGVSTDGHVLTSDGLGGAAWEAASGSGESTTVSDTGEIDLTLTGSDISGALITGSIDVLKLDSGVQTSLGLADSASQTDDQTAAEVTIADAGALITATDVEGALAENRTAINLNTSFRGDGDKGDVTLTSGNITIDSAAVQMKDLLTTAAPTDEYVLSYDATSVKGEWIDRSLLGALTPTDIGGTNQTLAQVDFGRFNFTDNSVTLTIDNTPSVGSRALFQPTDIDSIITVVPDTGVSFVGNGSGVITDGFQVDSLNVGQVYKLASNVYSVGGYIKPYSQFDADATAFIDAVATLTSAEQIAINDLVVGLKANGTWTKYDVIYPFIGGTAAEHKWNLKDPQDTDAAFRATFVSDGTHSATGWQGDGANDYISTSWQPNGDGTENNTAMTIYYNTDQDGSFRDGVQGTGVNMQFYPHLGGEGYIYWYDTNPNRTTTSSNGLFTVSRTNSTTLKLYQNGSQAGTTYATAQSQTWTNFSTYDYWIGAANISGTIGGAHTNIVQFFAIGLGITDTEAADDYTVIEAYQDALGRGVNP